MWFMTLVTLALFIAGFVFSFRVHGVSLMSVIFASFCVIGLLAILEVALVRVALRDDAAELVTLRRSRTIPRETIASVSRAPGSGVYLKLTDGTWVKLPQTGHNILGLANSISAWLRRTGSVRSGGSEAPT